MLFLVFLSLLLPFVDRRCCSLFVTCWLCVVVCCVFLVLLLIVSWLLFDVVRS